MRNIITLHDGSYYIKVLEMKHNLSKDFRVPQVLYVANLDTFKVDIKMVSSYCFRPRPPFNYIREKKLSSLLFGCK